MVLLFLDRFALPRFLVFDFSLHASWEGATNTPGKERGCGR